MKHFVRMALILMFVFSAITAQEMPTPAQAAKKQDRQASSASNLACFTNKYIRGCTRAYLSKDKKRVTVAATLKSRAAQSVLVGLLTTCYDTEDYHCKQVKSDMPRYSFPNAEILTDGKSIRATSTRGATAYFRRWVDRDKANINNMTVLDPGGKITITYFFVSDTPVNSSLYDFTSEAVMYIPSTSDSQKYTKRKFTISGTDVYFPTN